MKFNLKNIFNNIPPQHRGKVYGALAGLMVGILILMFRFWRILLLGIFVALGFSIGYVLDSNLQIRDKIKEFINRIIGRDDGHF